MLAIAAHASALWAGLVWDDEIVLSDQLVRIDGFNDAFFPPAGIPGWSDSYYRPLVILSYLLDFHLLPGRTLSWIPHLSNLLMHVGTTAGVWLLARRVLRNLPAGMAGALAAAMLFAVHPIHTESVNWITGRSDLLATLLVVPSISLAFYWRDSGSWPALLAGAILFFLALLAKEVAIAALVIIPAAWLLVESSRTARSQWFIGLAPYLLAAAAYFSLRLSAGVVLGTALEMGPGLQLVAVARSLAWYLLKLVVPWPQTIVVTWDLLPQRLVTSLVLLTALVVTAFAYRSWRRTGDGVGSLVVAWVLASLAPSLWIALSFGTHAPVAERYLYLPSVGAAVGIGYLVARGLQGSFSRIAWVLLGLAVAIYLAAAIDRGRDWLSSVRLWTDAVEKSPGDAFGWYSLANAQLAAGDDAAALRSYESGLAVARDPFEIARLLYATGQLRLNRGEFVGAEQQFQRSRQAMPDFSRAAFGLGLAYMLEAGRMDASRGRADTRDGLFASAEREFRALAVLAPDLPEAHVGLAQLAAMQGAIREREGQPGPARVRYEAALAELDLAQQALPPDQLSQYLSNLEAGLERDVPGLRARLVRALERLGVSE